mmetsp:Transcript_11377/g.28693  ORF Transcript_11377/g.28693 Transcript_11377/m.28693 type:complete len:245 (+) Transcript_11377:39-773(+)|eukprot:CAMPEP_0174232410 /NCGR_PEP_ID=MMETSP0417-20130205/2705_1 /TAXON_ID=242541 /ORGANISM="Mayorella sp, Strain BSH-02190019" /LENGTH=244 /DNA_ID=CAMNT_0015310459 /DNA_START=57 /DNA_END=791 /DNA_ORIENTATION=-
MASEREKRDQGPQKWVSCPYNELHTMPKSRLQWHLLKCSDANERAHLFRSCPYNFLHIIPKPEYDAHLRKCPSRAAFSEDQYTKEEDESLKNDMRAYLRSQRGASTPTPARAHVWSAEGTPSDSPHRFSGTSTSSSTLGFSQPSTGAKVATITRPRRGRKKKGPTDDSIVKQQERAHLAEQSQQAQDNAKEKRFLKKKLTEIKKLEAMQSTGQKLNDAQIKKMARRQELMDRLHVLTHQDHSDW